MILRFIIAILGAALIPSGSGAADLSGYGKTRAVCMQPVEQGGLAMLPMTELLPELELRFNRAVAMAGEARTIDDNRPAFLWALATQQACATAIGYIRGGVPEPDHIVKCACFHDRMIDGSR